MNEKDQFKLDAMSKLDDDVVDKTTELRGRLWRKMMERRKKKKTLVAILSSAASLFLMFGVVLVFLFLMKQVPVYTGMTVSNEFPTVSEEVARANPEDYVMIRAGGTSLRVTPMTALNQESLAEQTTGEETTEAETAPNVYAEETVYYARANEDIYITVHVDNPDNFVILQFTLNGKVYNSYMFEDGSDMENLILKYNVGDLLGLTEFTLDNIKYLDDGDYKDVRLEGDTTVLVGVYTDQRPTASVTEAKVNFTSISATFSVKDVGNLIALTSGKASAILYDDDGEKVAEQEIKLGEQVSLTFEELLPAETYRLAVESEYDALDGKGIQTYTLLTQKVTTQTVVGFDELNKTQTGLSFALRWDEAIQKKEVVSLTLYKNGTKLQDLDTTLTSVDGLLSDNEYTLTLDYRYDGKTYTVSLPFRTEAKAEPSYAIVNPTKTQTSIGFDLTETDPDNIGTATKIELLHKGVIVKTENADVRSFTDLLSNNEYTVRVTYTYDLNDGTGAQTKTAELAVRTEAKTEPTYVIQNPTRTDTRIGFDLTETDPDNIGTVTKIELWKDGQVYKSALDMNTRVFTELASYSQYTLKITYTYDLNDGTGVHEKTMEKIINTPAKEITVTDSRIEGNATIHLGESVTLRVTVNNPDSVSISSFVINGKTVSATVFGASSYLVEYTPALGGRESLSCSAALYALYNETYSQSISYADTDSILILGDVSIAKVELQAGKNVFEEGDEIVAVVTFVGSEGYEMKSIGLSGSYSSSPTRSLTKLTDTTYSFVLPNNTSSMELYEYQIVSVTYGIGSSTDTEEITSERLVYAVIPQQNSVIDISTPQQLQNLKMGKAYRLVKDIDMTGFDWQPYVFSGYLDGNGYKIKNLTINNLGNTAQPDRGKELWSAGLFSHFGGIMKDVVLENASIEIFASKEQGAPFAGFLFGFTGLSMADEYGQEEDALVLNCSVQGNITVYSQNTSIGYVGGLMGNCYDSSVYMLNCEYIGTITVTDQSNDEYTIEQLRSCTDPIGVAEQAYCTAYCDVTVNGVTVSGEEYSNEYDNQCKYYGYSQRPNQ